MRECISNANLKNAIRVESYIQARKHTTEVRFLDECAEFWILSWTVSGIVQCFFDNFPRYRADIVTTSDAYFIIYRYSSYL